MFFDLVGNDPGGNSSAVIDNARVYPDAIQVNTFTTTLVDDSLDGTGAVSHCDVDADGDADLILADRRGGLIVLANDGSGNFQQGGAVPADNGPDDVVPPAAPARVDGPSFTKFYVVDAESEETFQYGPDGSPSGSFTSNRAAADPRGVTSAGDHLWTVDGTSRQVFHYSSNGRRLGSWTAEGLVDPQGIATDGTDVWIVDAGRDELLRFDGAAAFEAGSHAPHDAFELASTNTSPTGVTTDGEFIWITDDGSDAVFVYSAAGLSLGQWLLDSENADPSGLALDGDNLWIVDRQQRAVFRYLASTRAGSLEAIGRFNLAEGNQVPEGIADPPLEIGEVVTDSIAVEGEIDSFTFEAVTGQILFFDAQVGSPSALEWSLISPASTPIFRSAFVDQGPITIQESGTFTLAVNGRTGPTGLYQFQVHAVPSTPVTSIRVGDVTMGTVDVPGASDAFVFDASAGDVLFFDAQVGSPSRFNWASLVQTVCKFSALPFWIGNRSS